PPCRIPAPWRAAVADGGVTGPLRSFRGRSAVAEQSMTFPPLLRRRRSDLKGIPTGAAPICLALIGLAGCTGSIAHLHPFIGTRLVELPRKCSPRSARTDLPWRRWLSDAVERPRHYDGALLLQSRTATGRLGLVDCAQRQAHRCACAAA